MECYVLGLRRGACAAALDIVTDVAMSFDKSGDRKMEIHFNLMTSDRTAYTLVAYILQQY
jgi:hypothetical protein